MRKTIKNLTLLAIAFSTSTIYASSYLDEEKSMPLKCTKGQRFEFEQEINCRKSINENFSTQYIEFNQNDIFYKQSFGKHKMEISIKGGKTEVKTHNPGTDSKELDALIVNAFKFINSLKEANDRLMYVLYHRNEHHCNDISQNNISVSDISRYTIKGFEIRPK